MTTHIDVAELRPDLVEDLSQNGGEIMLTRDGKPVAKLVRVDDEQPEMPNASGWPSAIRTILDRVEESKITVASSDHEDDGPLAGSILYEGDIISPVIDEPADDAPAENGRVLYKGEWMSAAGAERERSIEHLRGSIKILGDIVSPIDDVEYDALK